MQVVEARPGGMRQIGIHEAAVKSRWRINKTLEKNNIAFEKTKVLNRALKEFRGQGKFTNYNLVYSMLIPYYRRI
jgi:hypothetical protein